MLSQDNIKKIVDAYTLREEIKHFTYLANYEEIVEHDYNLSTSTYVEKEDVRENVDIVSLNAEIDSILKKEDELRERIANIIAEIEVQ